LAGKNRDIQKKEKGFDKKEDGIGALKKDAPANPEGKAGGVEQQGT